MHEENIHASRLNANGSMERTLNRSLKSYWCCLSFNFTQFVIFENLSLSVVERLMCFVFCRENIDEGRQHYPFDEHTTKLMMC